MFVDDRPQRGEVGRQAERLTPIFRASKNPLRSALCGPRASPGARVLFQELCSRPYLSLRGGPTVFRREYSRDRQVHI